MKEVFASGKALQRFCQMITFQGVEERFARSLCHPDSNPKELLKVGPNKTILTHQGLTGEFKFEINLFAGLPLALIENIGHLRTYSNFLKKYRKV